MLANRVIMAKKGYDSFTKSMLHFNGADLSTVFTDDMAKTWTTNNNAKLSSVAKFGTASGYFNGNAWIDTPAHADFNVGNGNFTIDFWIRRQGSLGFTYYVAGQVDSGQSGTSSSFWIALTSTDTIACLAYVGSTNYNIESGNFSDTSSFHHVAIVRNGINFTLYIDGVSVNSITTLGTQTINASTNKWAIGRMGEYGAGNLFNGYIDEFRFSKGIARWTTNFTPPTLEYK